MRAGRLRHRVSLQRPVEARDETTGGVTITWEGIGLPRAAELVSLSGRELIAAQAVQSEVIARCVMRYLDGVDATMRIVHNGQPYNIKAVLPDPTFKRSLTLMLAAGVNDGQ